VLHDGVQTGHVHDLPGSFPVFWLTLFFPCSFFNVYFCHRFYFIFFFVKLIIFLFLFYCYCYLLLLFRIILPSPLSYNIPPITQFFQTNDLPGSFPADIRFAARTYPVNSLYFWTYLVLSLYFLTYLVLSLCPKFES